MKIKEEYKNTIIFLILAISLVIFLTLVIFLSYYANTLIR